MRIVIDIGHPAHVHFFKNFIWEMTKRGHDLLITATDKDVTTDLLHNYGFNYVNMGSYGNSVAEKALNILPMDIKMYRAVKSFKPDILVGVSPIRAAHISVCLRKPCIAFDDSELSPYEHTLYMPFVRVILTPSSFKKDFGKKQIRYNGYHEIAYLHPDYFQPDISVMNSLGLGCNDRFVIMRFVAWSAVHDARRHGFDLVTKRKLVEEISKYARVFITSEKPLSEEFEKFRIPLSPEKILDLLYYSTLLIGDTQTMTTEAGILGTPAIRCNTFVGSDDMGNFIELEHKYDLIYSFSQSDEAIQKAVELLNRHGIKKQWADKREKLFKDKINVTRFLVDFVEGFPKSLYRYMDSKGN